MTDPARQEVLRSRLEALGFDDVRFAALNPPVAPPLREWLAAGMHADMHWLERGADKRLAPDLVLPGVRSLLLLGVSYWSDRLPPSPSPAPSGATRARWARYALHEDYHDTIKPGLVAAGRLLEELYGAAPTDYRYYVDTGPVLERAWAARAGLGFTGKNAMLISRRHGNWLFLASLLTRLDFTPDAPLKKPQPPETTVPTPNPEPKTQNPGLKTDNSTLTPPVGLLCGKCTRCLTACPTNAFAAPGVVDARRCVSYQTIENKGVIPRELRAGIGHRIYGCDVCLEVCPWNRFARQGRQLLLASRHDLADLTLATLLDLNPESFATVFRRTPIKRLKLAGLLRNACIVAGNAGDPSLLPPLLRLATAHPLPLVRAHAVWAVHRLGGAAALTAARAAETDPLVRAEYDAELPVPA